MILNIHSKEKLLLVDRFDIYCNHNTNGRDTMRVEVKFDNKSTEIFTVVDDKNYQNEIAGIRYSEFTI